MKVIFDKDYTKTEDLRMKFFSQNSQGIVLDIGSFQLQNKYLLDNKKINKVLGVDFEIPQNIIYDEFLRVDLNENNVHMPFENKKFDTVIAGEVLEHLNNPMLILSECFRILKDDGKFILSMPNSWFVFEIIRELINFKVPTDEEHLYRHNKLSVSILLRKNGFKIEKIFSYKLYLPLTKISIISFNLPLFLSYQMIFICRKNKK